MPGVVDVGRCDEKYIAEQRIGWIDQLVQIKEQFILEEEGRTFPQLAAAFGEAHDLPGVVDGISLAEEGADEGAEVAVGTAAAGVKQS